MNKRSFIISLLIIVFIRVVLAALCPPVADESYYMIWHKYLDWSYVDHPGMIAWINYLFNQVIKDTLFAVRSVALFLYFISILFIYKSVFLISENKEKSYLSAIIFALIPYNLIVGITMQVEQPLLAFTAIVTFYYLMLLKTESRKMFYYIAFFSALGTLSKYTMLVVTGSYFLFILFNNRYRILMFSKEFFLSIFLYLGMMFPIVYWNMNNKLQSLAFHSGRFEGVSFQYIPDFLLNATLYASPVLIFLFILSLKRKVYKKSPYMRDLILLCLLVFITFLIVSFKVKVWGHWVAVMYVPLSIVVAVGLYEIRSKILYWMTGFSGVLLLFLLFISPGVIFNVNDLLSNYRIAQGIESIRSEVAGQVHIYADFHGSAGQLTYYGNTRVYLPLGVFKKVDRWGEAQFALWGTALIDRGDTVLYYGDNDPVTKSKLEAFFTSVSVVSDYKLRVLEPHINKKVMYLCEGSELSFNF
jgi:dolichol-phosphate mannosyltransferase